MLDTSSDLGAELMGNKSEILKNLIVFAFCFWCLFWMIQPAIYYPEMMEWRWFGFPAHYAFWLIGMMIAVPAACFLYAIWADRMEKSLKKNKEGE